MIPAPPAHIQFAVIAALVLVFIILRRFYVDYQDRCKRLQAEELRDE